MPLNPRADRYNHTPRKVFDTAMDRMDIKRQRDRQDHRADLGAIIQKMDQLETRLTELEAYVAQHCLRIDSDHPANKDGYEELE